MKTKKKKAIDKKQKGKKSSDEYTMRDMVRVQKMNGVYNTQLGAVARQVMREAGLK